MTDIHSTSASHFDYLHDDAPNPAGVSVTDLDPQQRLIRLRTLLVPLGNHLASHPEDAYLLYDEAASMARDAAALAPEATIIEETYSEEGGVTPATVLNPRTGTPDTLVAVDISERHTELDEVDIDGGAKTIHIEYDETADYHGLLYITESDQLPVSLPENWNEV